MQSLHNIKPMKTKQDIDWIKNHGTVTKKGGNELTYLFLKKYSV